MEYLIWFLVPLAVSFVASLVGYLAGYRRATNACYRLRKTYPGPPFKNDKGEIEVTHPWQLSDALNRPQVYQTKR